jgi:hypothetical protein
MELFPALISLLVTMFIAALAVPLIALFIQWRYVTRVADAMSSRAAAAHSPFRAVEPRGTFTTTTTPLTPFVALDSGSSREQLVLRARQAALTTRRIYVVAGVAFGFCTPALYAVTLLPTLDLPPEYLVATPFFVISFAIVFMPLFVWLLIPTMTFSQLITSRTAKLSWLAIGLYFGIINVVFPPAVPLMSVPVMTIALVALPIIRGVAWFITPISMTCGVALLWLPLLRGATPQADTITSIVVIVFITLGTAIRLWLVVHQYSTKRISDTTLVIMQWWFIEAAILALVSLVYSSWGVFAFTVTYAGLDLVVVRRLRRLQTRALKYPAVSLLFLRTFGNRRRTSRLLSDIGSRWRWIGSIQAISAGDIAASTLDPHEFLDYIRGRTDSNFVRSTQDLTQRLATLDIKPDRDGRYRINEFFCGDEMWRSTVQQLVRMSTVVLIDLRGFGPRHQGVIYELEQLASLSRLEQVVAITDEATSMYLLARAVDRASILAPPAFNTRPSISRINIYNAGRTGRVNADELFGVLCRAASSQAAPRK